MTELQVNEYLTPEEELQLEQDESEVIKFGTLALENANRAGEILKKISDSNLFKKKRRNSEFPAFEDFGDYCKAKFGRGKTMAYNYMHINTIMTALKDEGHDPLELGSISNAMEVYFELKRLGYYKRNKLHPLFREILHKGMTIIENVSPIDSVSGEVKITPNVIKAAFETINQISVHGAYEIDGRQVPITLQQIAVDDQASQIMYEEIQQRRLQAFEQEEKKKQRRFEIKNVTPTVVFDNRKEVYIECPEHGTTSVRALLNAGVKMECDCNGIIETTKDGTKLVHYKESE